MISLSGCLLALPVVNLVFFSGLCPPPPPPEDLRLGPNGLGGPGMGETKREEAVVLSVGCTNSM